MLVLPIKKKWFDMIRSGEKKEEYRDIKEYWGNRIGNALIGFPLKWCHDSLIQQKMQNETLEVIFRNGYSPFSPEMWCKCKVKIGQGKEEWGAEKGKEYYILEILEILSVYGEEQKND